MGYLEQEIDGQTFLGLTAANLSEIGIKFGPKLKLTAYIARLKEAQPETSQIESLENGCPTEEKDVESQTLVKHIVSAFNGGQKNDWEVVIREFDLEDNSNSSSSIHSGASTSGSISTSGGIPSGTSSEKSAVANDFTPTEAFNLLDNDQTNSKDATGAVSNKSNGCTSHGGFPTSQDVTVNCGCKSVEIVSIQLISN